MHPLNFVLTCLHRPFRRFCCSVFMASISSAAQSTIPLQPRKIRNGQHGTGRYPPYRWCPRHWLAFTLTPSLSTVRHGSTMDRTSSSTQVCSLLAHRTGRVLPPPQNHIAALPPYADYFSPPALLFGGTVHSVNRPEVPIPSLQCPHSPEAPRRIPRVHACTRPARPVDATRIQAHLRGPTDSARYLMPGWPMLLAALSFLLTTNLSDPPSRLMSCSMKWRPVGPCYRPS
jgi:hypothetical protein